MGRLDDLLGMIDKAVGEVLEERRDDDEKRPKVKVGDLTPSLRVRFENLRMMEKILKKELSEYHKELELEMNRKMREAIRKQEKMLEEENEKAWNAVYKQLKLDISQEHNVNLKENAIYRYEDNQ